MFFTPTLFVKVKETDEFLRGTGSTFLKIQLKLFTSEKEREEESKEERKEGRQERLNDACKVR